MIVHIKIIYLENGMDQHIHNEDIMIISMTIIGESETTENQIKR